MALQRSTGILLAIAVVVGGITYGISQRQSTPPVTVATDGTTQLFTVTEEQIASLSLEVEGQTLDFQQQGEAIGQWLVSTPQQPTPQQANRGAISFLLNLLQYQGNELFAVTAAALQDYGLTEPYATLTMRLTDGGDRRLSLGSENFDGTKIYGRVDDELTVWVLPIDFRNAVTREVTEWLAPEDTTDEGAR